MERLRSAAQERVRRTAARPPASAPSARASSASASALRASALDHSGVCDSCVRSRFSVPAPVAADTSFQWRCSCAPGAGTQLGVGEARAASARAAREQTACGRGRARAAVRRVHRVQAAPRRRRRRRVRRTCRGVQGGSCGWRAAICGRQQQPRQGVRGGRRVVGRGAWLQPLLHGLPRVARGPPPRPGWPARLAPAQLGPRARGERAQQPGWHSTAPAGGCGAPAARLLGGFWGGWADDAPPLDLRDRPTVPHGGFGTRAGAPARRARRSRAADGSRGACLRIAGCLGSAQPPRASLCQRALYMLPPARAAATRLGPTRSTMAAASEGV
jgi:hypothetical protein